ncbi:hypothetical protein GVN16_09855 [Emticicia sp. CRIBPO]|uniref:hypothetical protein n=1 Tax=Emticicia sp. CRIBPO TaxID=2683258 RepID=UPI0014134E55|nr:hypothetical protein [Emticicia sp. CRIBPO]NBA86066.1 hypothetical protein [Emticicia sp. CRIBPO]
MKYFVSKDKSAVGQLTLLILSLIFFSIFIYFDITEEIQNPVSGRIFILIILFGVNYFSSKLNVIHLENSTFFVRNLFKKTKVMPASEFDRVKVYFVFLGVFKIAFYNGEEFLFIANPKTAFKTYFVTDFKKLSNEISDEVRQLIVESNNCKN